MKPKTPTLPQQRRLLRQEEEQAHEKHVLKQMKDRGMVSPDAALRRWVNASPQVAIVIAQRKTPGYD